MSAYLRRGPRDNFLSECCTGGESVTAPRVNRSVHSTLNTEHEAGQATSTVFMSSVWPCRESNPAFHDGACSTNCTTLPVWQMFLGVFFVASHTMRPTYFIDNWPKPGICFLSGRLRRKSLDQGALWRFTQWPRIELTTLQLRVGHHGTELSPLPWCISETTRNEANEKI